MSWDRNKILEIETEEKGFFPDFLQLYLSGFGGFVSQEHFRLSTLCGFFL